jgi:hypothetical protein
MPGNLKVLPWAGFKAAVSYNFDDANSSQLNNYSQLNGLGVPFTFYLIGNKISAGPTTKWAQALKDGHELANHTYDHNTVAQSNVDMGKSTIESDFSPLKVYTFAAPNGDTGYQQYVQNKYLLDRGVSNGSMLPGNETMPSPWNTYCYIPPASAQASDYQSQIDQARSTNGWRVILVHGFQGGSDGAYQAVDLNQYLMGVMYAKTFADLWIGKMVDVGAYWRGQNAFQKNMPTGTPATMQTWTWTLPPAFPPGKYLRVMVDGGTLTQNGTPLVWDTHGYYEVSLDVGTLTLSP